MTENIYMDYNATAPTKAVVIEAMVDAMRHVGNASSVHASGRNARKTIEEARAKVASLINARPRDIVFTSGGTEANNTVLKGTGAASLIVSKLEHDSVLATAKSADIPVYYINVDESGLVSLDHLHDLLQTAPKPALVSVMLANNEIGTIEPIADCAAIASEFGAKIHCDAVQGSGKIAIDFEALGVDYLTLSAHKMGGPQGVGAIVLKPTAPLKSIIEGGGQELGRRSGTENVAAISGFGAAVLDAFQDIASIDKIRELKEHLESGIRKIGNDIMIVADKVDRIANTSCIILPGISGETQVMHFDLAGISLSSGSACSSGKVKVSHVLSALGLADSLANSSIRVSLGFNSTADDVDKFLSVYADLYKRTEKRRNNA